MIDVLRVGQRVNQLRELRGLSLGGLAEHAGISKSYLAKLERGEIENPGLKTVQFIAEALGTTLADLLALPPAAGSEVSKYEQRLARLPEGLREFLEAQEQKGEKVPADLVRALASIQFRGKRPQTAADWRFVYDAIRRSL